MGANARRLRAVLLAGSLGVTGAMAAFPGPGAASSDPARSITVFLRPVSEAVLDHLAADPGPLTTARGTALDRALPSAQAQREAEELLRTRGFTITGATSWSVSATAPASAVTSTFGPASTATGLFGKIPLALRTLSSAVFATTGGRPAVRAHALTGTDFRDAYSTPALTRARIAPYNGRYAGARPTIATIQFSGWNRDDLAQFARRNRLPYDATTLAQVPVSQRSVPTTSEGDGAIEVALDQEAILATDRYAHQRAYFAPNSNAGFANAFSQVLDDVRGDSHAYRGGDRHITALSVSWGDCETSDASPYTVVNPILKSLVAAGVTVFAASGDDGAYDCSGLLANATQGVDFPASSPYVVGVGGTHLGAGHRSPNDAHNWSETAWSCDDVSDCSGGLLGLTGGRGGSGGGASSVFAQPTYQTGIGGSRRMVPDIAADADPASGMRIYTSKESDPELTVGGTSLAAPVEASLFTNMLSAHGVARGIGDIHRTLYAAARRAGAFRDITSGTNGAFVAGHGYDAVTGLGAPLWPEIGRRVFGTSTLRPRVTWSVNRHTRHPRVTVRWRTDTHALFATVTITRAAGALVARRLVASPSSHLSFRGKAGRTYVARITVTSRKSHQISPIRTHRYRLRR